MKSQIVLSFVAVLISCGMVVQLYAQTNNIRTAGTVSPSDRMDLKTQTLVGKTLTKVENGAGGEKIYHYTYRVHARATEKKMPRYVVDPQYSISYKQHGFREGDSIRLRSTNPESASDSPIWVYDVTYVGSGTRSLTFATSGSVRPPLFAPTDEVLDVHCGLCRHETIADCQAHNCQCRCCADDQINCNCSGCQYQTPRCFACPVGCTCDHCVCSCDGCLTQSPRCLSCSVGCACDHCRCKCEEDIDHLGRCGCVLCQQKPLTCECECHSNCP